MEIIATDHVSNADHSLERLMNGNRRFVEGQPTGLGTYRYSRDELSEGQRPYATILGCSDSRVPPELIFDTGLGEVFVIRVAGNIFSSVIAGSMQYAGSHLNSPLFVVLGHTKCGAVDGALRSIDNKTRHAARIQNLVDLIEPGIKDIDRKLSYEERLDIAVGRNVRWTVQQILDTPEGKIREAEGKFKIVGAIYDIDTGQVNILD